MQQATVNLLADMGAQPGTLQGGLVAGDRLDRHGPRRARVINSPLAGANVESGQPITISGTATDAAGSGGVRSAASRSRSTAAPPGTRRRGARAGPTPGRPGATGSATIKTRAADDSGNLETPGAGRDRQRRRRAPAPARSGTTPSRSPPTTTPNAVELGVKFRSDEAGFITGLRFYKTLRQHRHPRRPPVDGGRHPAGRGDLHRRDRLRLAAGQLRQPGGDRRQHDLRRLLPRAERPLRRQQQLLRRPAASTTRRCTRSATASTGRTASTSTGHPEGCSPARAPTPSSRATTGSTSSSTTTSGRTRRRRRSTRARPRSGASGRRHRRQRRPRPSASRWTPARSTAPTFELRDPSNALVPATVTYDARDTDGRRSTRTAPLQNSTTYTATVRAARRRQGRAPATRSPPTRPGRSPPRRRRRRRPTRGPAGPILVISNAANPFSRYYAEILRAEGLNEFTATDISNVTPAILDALRRRDPRRDAAHRRPGADAERLGQAAAT